MKSNLRVFALILMLALSTQVGAQSWLKKVGKKVDDAIKKEVVNRLQGEKEKQEQQNVPAKPTAPTNSTTAKSVNLPHKRWLRWSIMARISPARVDWIT